MGKGVISTIQSMIQIIVLVFTLKVKHNVSNNFVADSSFARVGRTDLFQVATVTVDSDK